MRRTESLMCDLFECLIVEVVCLPYEQSLSSVGCHTGSLANNR